MKKKLNLREHLSYDTLDLSLNDLQDVPVKEIASIPKATALDLSNNKLATLPKNFPSSLTHLVKLDLSQNRLTELPENFGLLVHLNHLDLYKNALTTLPLSFGSLKALRWLDLKNNPLVPKMAKVVGPCLDTSQCQSAAKSVVSFLGDMQRQVEEEKRRRAEQRRIQEEQNAEQLEKKEAKKKKKKKAKNMEGNKGVTENGTHVMEQEASEAVDMTKNLKNNSQQSNKSRPSRVGMFLSGIVKFVAIIVMLSMLSLFIISLIDEPTYQMIKTRLNLFFKSASAKMPKNMLEAWNKSLALTAHYGKLLLENTSIAFRAAVLMVHEWYVWFSTDEKIQIYVETVRHYWHVAYIKMTEYITTAVNYISTYVKN